MLFRSSEDRRNILSILNKKLNVHENNQEVSDQSDVLIICVKPQVFKEAAQSFTTESNEKMIISVAAGIEIDSMASLFGEGSKVCRVMPNTPCLVGRGISALIQSNLTESEIVLATYIFNSVGKTIWVQNEEWMHAITAVSGSGPAYFFHMMDLLKKAAMKLGTIPIKERVIFLNNIKNIINIPNITMPKVNICDLNKL